MQERVHGQLSLALFCFMVAPLLAELVDWTPPPSSQCASIFWNVYAFNISLLCFEGTTLCYVCMCHVLSDWLIVLLWLKHREPWEIMRTWSVKVDRHRETFGTTKQAREQIWRAILTTSGDELSSACWMGKQQAEHILQNILHRATFVSDSSKLTNVSQKVSRHKDSMTKYGYFTRG